MHSTLFDYLKTVNNLVRHHNFSGEYIESLIPFERDFHVGIIINDLKEKKREQERQS